MSAAARLPPGLSIPEAGRRIQERAIVVDMVYIRMSDAALACEYSFFISLRL